MAQKVLVTSLCDLPHDGAEIDAANRIEFGWGGLSYELDSCDSHAKEITGEFEGLIASARQVSAKRPPLKRTTKTRKHDAAVREWAAAMGYKISDRGRIPAHILSDYAREHPGE